MRNAIYVIETKMEKRDECSGWSCSNCCGASIILGDICFCCGKECKPQCVNCSDEDIELCQEIQ